MIMSETALHSGNSGSITVHQGANGFGASFESKSLIKNYAAGMAAASLYWPGAASGFEATSGGVYGSMAAAYSQASAFAAAAASTMQMVTNSQTNGGSSDSSTPISDAGSPSALTSTLPTTGVSAASFHLPLSSAAAAVAFGGLQPVHSTTPGTPKKKPQPVPDTQKDETYWERRKRNNESARRSRESRRMKEEQIALRTVYLEQENLQLRTEVSMLRSEIEKLRMILYQQHQQQQQHH